jgi:bifunctional non-homologous end joining protein LigD
VNTSHGRIAAPNLRTPYGAIRQYSTARLCLQPDGRSYLYNLMLRREWPYFMAFDPLWLNGEDLRGLPLHQRKRRLARIMPRIPSRVRLVEQVQGCGVDFFNVARQYDLEGIVAKWANGTYRADGCTSWLKIRNPQVFAMGRPTRIVRGAT